MTKDSTAISPRSGYILWFSRIFTGLLFVFSGLIKANDPTGFGYKLQEYFNVLGMSFLNDYAVALAVVICSLEILLGALLLLGLWCEIVAWGLLLLILFFTFLTFYSAFFEVVSSCGCFGDAIPLTPWQSFLKDLVLLALILVIFKYRDQIKPVFSDQYTTIITTVALAIVSIGIGVYTVNFLPFIDFLPYKKGNHLPSLMVMPEGEEGDVYALTYTLVHKSTGESKEVSDQVYLEEEIWKDEDWEIVGEPKSRLVRKGYTVPIPDLLIADVDGRDVTMEILENPNENFVVVAWDLDHTNKAGLEKINALVREAALAYHIRPVLLTASPNRDAEALSNELGLIMEILYADAVPLKSMVRANPGVLLLRDGVVIEKWHYNTVPTFEEFERKYLEVGE